MRDNPVGLGILLGALLWALILVPTCAFALRHDSAVPVLLYHSRNVGPDCSDLDTDVYALRRDLEVIRQAGFEVVPLSDIVDWYLGKLGSALPEHVVGISVDDGFDRDWLDNIPHKNTPGYPCSGLPSVRSIAEANQAPITFFVIGARQARQAITEDWMNDNWWATADAHPLFAVENHGIDHDHSLIRRQTLDKQIHVYLPAGGFADGNWFGLERPERIDTWWANTVHIQRSAVYIQSKTGRRPRLFAHPFGRLSGYTESVYLPQEWWIHRTDAAFCIEGGTHYVTKSSPQYCLPRFTYGHSWRTASELADILEGSR